MIGHAGEQMRFGLSGKRDSLKKSAKAKQSLFHGNRR
jgi:hypothetical protein